MTHVIMLQRENSLLMYWKPSLVFWLKDQMPSPLCSVKNQWSFCLVLYHLGNCHKAEFYNEICRLARLVFCTWKIISFFYFNLNVSLGQSLRTASCQKQGPSTIFYKVHGWLIFLYSYSCRYSDSIVAGNLIRLHLQPSIHYHYTQERFLKSTKLNDI